MATKLPRIQVTLEKDVAEQIYRLSKLQKKSASKLMSELTIEALELREDYYLSKLADKIDTENAKTCSHEELWK
jgi:hypothetical protein